MLLCLRRFRLTLKRPVSKAAHLFRPDPGKRKTIPLRRFKIA
jgi:hypothetical protein